VKVIAPVRHHRSTFLRLEIDQYNSGVPRTMIYMYLLTIDLVEEKVPGRLWSPVRGDLMRVVLRGSGVPDTRAKR